jgi:bifunctional DNase/RNase
VISRDHLPREEEGIMRRLSKTIILCVLLAGGVLAPDQPVLNAQTDQIKIEDVDVRLTEHGPVVLLRAQNKTIPIFVDQTVAGSIHGALTGVKMGRPLSHDLMHAILEAFEGKVTKTEITLKDGIYYGALTVEIKDSEKVFDSRSSDAIALAIHFKAPIIVGRDLLDSAGKTNVFEEEAPIETL